MLQIRAHGRGGQGVVTLAELLAQAAFESGHEAQAFPSFGSERMGAPVMAFCRIDDAPIRTRQPVTHPDVVVICDPTLLHSVEVFAGLRAGGTVIVNSSRPPEALGLASLGGAATTVTTLPAKNLARRVTGSTRSNVVLLAACAYLLGIFAPEVARAVAVRRFPHGRQDELVDAACRWLAEHEQASACVG